MAWWGDSVWINKRTGIVHLSRSCRWLGEVPDGALRVVAVEGVKLPPSRGVCPSCVEAARENFAAPVAQPT